MGPNSFISTLNELKFFLKFNCLQEKLNINPNIILYHIDALKDKGNKKLIEKGNVIKICAGKKKRYTN